MTPVSFFGLLFSMSNMSSLMRGSFVRSARFDPCTLVEASRGFSQCRAQTIVRYPRCRSEGASYSEPLSQSIIELYCPT